MFASTTGKYPYFPNLELRVRTTPFKSHQVEFPDLYKDYKGDGYIYKIDCLESLSDLLPVDRLRDKVYLLVSGDCTDDELSQLLIRFYRESPAFKNYVDEVFISKPDSLIKEIITPLRERILAYKQSVVDWSSARKGKHVIWTHDYEIVKFGNKVELPFTIYTVH